MTNSQPIFTICLQRPRCKNDCLKVRNIKLAVIHAYRKVQLLPNFLQSFLDSLFQLSKNFTNIINTNKGSSMRKHKTAEIKKYI